MENNTHQIDDKFYKECGVVMLATDKTPEYSNIFNNSVHGLLICDDNHIRGDVFNIFTEYKKDKTQHLYIISDDKIEEGDWYVNYIVDPKDFNSIIIDKINKADLNNTNEFLIHPFSKYCKKIIATTDSKLKSLELTQYGKDWIDIPLPRPSNEFIQAYVKANGKGFDKVLVEYRKSNYEDWIKTAKNQPEYQLKISPDNTITIKPVVEKLYTLEEMHKLMDDYQDYLFKTNEPVQTFKEWFITK